MGFTVAVVGLGKVGLPLAVHYASKGVEVIGCDINPVVVAMVNEGRSPIRDEHGLEEALSDVHRAGRLRATTETSAAVRTANVVVVIVPLLVNGAHEIDFRIIDRATAAIGTGLQRGTTVIVETTLPVGTTRQRIATMLETTSGLAVSRDFWLAFSPERIRTGRIFRDLRTYPKVVGGLSAMDTTHAAAFYEAVLDAPVLSVSSAEAAELTKLMETSYRDVNIALANEFAVFAAARGLDVHESIAAANTQEQSDIHQPGIGVGGHCIPVYPYFLLNEATACELQLPRVARKINDEMPRMILDVIKDELDLVADKRAIILGLSYRANVKEAAFSVTFQLVRELEGEGYQVSVCDPLFSDDEVRASGLTPAGMDAVSDYPVVIIQSFHDAFQSLPDTVFDRATLVIDGRGTLLSRLERSEAAAYLQVGRPPVRRAACT